ncbi:MAG: hypothetical protein AAF393_03880 [Pseudomonadota bacterium]
MQRRMFVLGATTALLGGPALSQEAGLTAAEITTLLSGKTAIGVWAGADYRQWFSEDGSTIYAPKGQRSTVGKWRVDANTNLYESWWNGDLWETYGIVRADDQLFWTDPTGERHLFEVLDGQQLIWPE